MTEVLDSRVLVLNKNYEPINIITVRKALKKLINFKAEVVSVEDEAFVGYNLDSWAEISYLKRECDDMDECDEMIGSDGFSIIAPTIIRALSYDKTYRQPIRLSRKNIFLRDGNICQFCGKKFPTEKLTLDHVIPRAQGGINAWDNLVCSCYKCNNKKGCQTPEQAKMKLLKKPVKPSAFATFEVPKDVKKYKNWDSFISDVYWATELKE
jgi:5-methylcytosine-specific restriction endonuclease McrA